MLAQTGRHRSQWVKTKCAVQNNIANIFFLVFLLTLTFPVLQVKGVKGASVFMLFKEFNLVEGFVPDWMHGICLGLIKNLLAFWLNGEHKSKDFYIGNKVYMYNKWLDVEFHKCQNSLIFLFGSSHTMRFSIQFRCHI